MCKRLEWLVVTYVYLTDSNHMLYSKRDTTWATWLFLVQAVRLKPNIVQVCNINVNRKP